MHDLGAECHWVSIVIIVCREEVVLYRGCVVLGHEHVTMSLLPIRLLVLKICHLNLFSELIQISLDLFCL